MQSSRLDAPADSFRATQWRILFVTMFCYLFFYTGRQTFGFAIPGIEEELGISKSELGWISAAMLWSYALGQWINGNLGDKFGGRRMMTIGAVTSCGLNWVTSFGSSALSLFIPWTANGFAQSMGWAPGSRVLANWWSAEERGKVYGLYVFAAGMSSVLAYTTSTAIIALEMDWRWIFRLPVLLLLFGGLAYYLLVRDRPEQLGFPPLSYEGEDDGLPDPADTPVAAQETSRTRYMHVLSNPRFLIASVAIGFQSLARYGLLVWVPVHLLGADWKSSETMWIGIALPVGMALGAIASGWISDNVFHSNRSRAISLFMALAAVVCGAMFYLPKEHPLAIVLLFLAGFFAYGPQSAFWALCPDLLGHQRAGTGTGVMNTFAYVFAGIGEPFIGGMIERNDDTSLVFAIVAISCALSATIAPLIRR